MALAYPRGRRRNHCPRPGRERRLGGDRDRGADRVEQPGAARELAGQRAVEGVARPGRVDRLDARRGDPLERVAVDHERAVGAERHHDRRAGARRERARGGLRSSSPASARASSRLGVSRGESSSSSPGQLARRGGVEHDLEVRRAGGPRPGEHGRVGHLEAEQHDAPRRVAQALLDGAGVDRRRRPAPCSTAAPSSALAPEATAIWFSPASSTTIRATPVALPSSRATPETSIPSARSRASLLAEVVVADGAHHPHPRPEPRRGHGLVGALAAAVALERPARHRLAGAGSVAAVTTRSTLTEPTT